MVWLPTTEAELVVALADQTLFESDRVDFKREMAPAGHNEDLAKTLAAMSLYGGAIIYGVDEQDDPEPAIAHPIPIQGLKERVAQVAGASVEDPVGVETRVIPSQRNGLGYLVVIVPVSATPPHRAAGHYWGRNGTINRRLSHDEVAMWFERRSQWQTAFESVLQKEIERDLIGAGYGQEAHLFVALDPVGADRDLLLGAMGDLVGRFDEWIRNNLVLYGGAATPLTPDWHPDLIDAHEISRRASGWACHTQAVLPHRRSRGDVTQTERGALDVEMTEAGEVRLYSACATSHRDGRKVAEETSILGLTKRAILVAAMIGERSGFSGSWDTGVAITNLSGAISSAVLNGFYTGTPYSENEYRQVVRLTTQELRQDPDAVVNRLLGRLNRAFNGDRFPVPVGLPNALSH